MKVSTSLLGGVAGLAIVAAVLLGAATSLLLDTREARPHSAMSTAMTPLGWEYPTRCCWGPASGRTGDCGMIPSSAVTEGPNGYQLTLKPGDHPYITKPASFVVAYDRAEVAPDGAYHVCFARGAGGALTVRCFFAGARNF